MAGDALLAGRRWRLTSGAFQALALILVVLLGLYAFLHYMQTHLVVYPFLVLLLPPITVAGIGTVLPLMMYITYQADFAGLQPCRPLHFWLIAKRCYTAFARNNLKVAEKDL